MEYKSKEQMLEVLLKSLPYPNQIEDIDLSGTDHIYFTWRRNRFKIETYGFCNTVDGGCLLGDNVSILLRELMKTVWTYMEIDSQRKGVTP